MAFLRHIVGFYLQSISFPSKKKTTTNIPPPSNTRKTVLWKGTAVLRITSRKELTFYLKNHRTPEVQMTIECIAMWAGGIADGSYTNIIDSITITLGKLDFKG